MSDMTEEDTIVQYTSHPFPQKGRLDLEGRLVWITGASSGLGKELAFVCCMKGARVIISGSHYDRLEKAWQECLQISKNCYPVMVNMEYPDDFSDTVQRVIAKHGPVDLLILNAGVSQRAKALETTFETLNHLMNINFMGAARLATEILPSMIKNGGGRIAVTTSLSGLFGFPARSGYCASKHALHGYFEALSLEYQNNNIGVSIISPGRINTPISRNALKGDGSIYAVTDKAQQDGMAVRKCALKYINMIEKRYRSGIIASPKEKLLLFIRRRSLSLFFAIMNSGKIK